jgi:hypothetical protein
LAFIKFILKFSDRKNFEEKNEKKEKKKNKGGK